MKKIVIVEDDINILSSLTAKFSSFGYEVIAYRGIESINEILDSIKINDISFIILDLILPKIDGFDLLKKIKENMDDIIAPVFVFSDVSDEDIRTRCDFIGADYFIIKQDLHIDEFVKKVLKIISNNNKNKYDH